MTGAQRKGMELLAGGLTTAIKVAERLHLSATDDFDLADRMALIVADLKASQEQVVAMLTDKNR